MTIDTHNIKPSGSGFNFEIHNALAWGLPELKHAEVRVLLYLYASTDHRTKKPVTRSYENIGEACGMQASYARKVCASLKDAGLIKWSTKGHGAPCNYTVQDDAILAKYEQHKLDNETPGQQAVRLLGELYGQTYDMSQKTGGKNRGLRARITNMDSSLWADDVLPHWNRAREAMILKDSWRDKPIPKEPTLAWLATKANWASVCAVTMEAEIKGWDSTLRFYRDAD